MLKGVESYKYLSELWAFLVLYAKSSRRDDCKMHSLRSDAFLYAKNAKSSRRDDCKMHILRSDAFLYAKNAKSSRRDDCKMHILRSDAFLNSRQRSIPSAKKHLTCLCSLPSLSAD